MLGLDPGPLYDGAVTQAVPTRAPRTPAPGALRSGVVIATSLAAWSIGAYVFYLLAGRLLGPAEYGLAAALQAVIVVVALPMTALQWSSARVVATSTSDSEAAAVYRRTLVTSTLYACALAAAATLVTVFVAANSNGIPAGALVAMYWSLVPVVPLFVAIGVLQGQHRYAAFGWSYGLTGVLRPILLLLLIAAPVLTRVESTVVATGIPYAIGAGLAVWLTRSLLRSRSRPSTQAWRSFRSGLGAAAIGLAGIALVALRAGLALRTNVARERVQRGRRRHDCLARRERRVVDLHFDETLAGGVHLAEVEIDGEEAVVDLRTGDVDLRADLLPADRLVEQAELQVEDTLCGLAALAEASLVGERRSDRAVSRERARGRREHEGRSQRNQNARTKARVEHH